MVLAHNAQSRQDANGTRTWLFATAALGAVFLGGQVFEFTTFIVEDGMKLSTNPAASAFYLLTGFHGTRRHWSDHAPVLVGISRRRGGLSDVTAQSGAGRSLLALRRHHLDRDLHCRLSARCHRHEHFRTHPSPDSGSVLEDRGGPGRADRGRSGDLLHPPGFRPRQLNTVLLILWRRSSSSSSSGGTCISVSRSRC